MKVLFAIIMTVVFVAGHLLFPNVFQGYNGTDEYTQMIQDMSGDAPGVNLTISTPTPAYVERPTNVPTAAVPAAVPAIDPAALFGEPKVTEDFERGSSGFGLNAGLNDDEGIRIIALNNRLSLEPKKSNGWLSWRLRPPVFGDGAAEMEFSITTCARGDRMGIMLHAFDYTGGRSYYISLACEGVISILRDSTVLASGTAGSAFRNNSGDINVLTAVSQGNTISVLLNGTPMLQVQDDTYAQGYSGFFTAPQESGTLTLDILSFKEYYPD